MAHKRSIEVPNRAEEVLLFSDQGRKDRLFRIYARAWYWTAVMAIDIALLLELPGALKLSAGATALVIIALFLLQMVIFIQYGGKALYREGRVGMPLSRP
jgi:hypothetical protein